MMARTPTLLEQVADPGGLEAAWREVVRGDLGDGELSTTMRDFLGDLDVNLAALRDSVLGGHVFGALTRISIGDPADPRVLRLPPAADRVVENRIVDVLERWVDPWFHPTSFAFRRGLGIPDVTRWIADRRDAGLTWAARTDVRDCFDTVPHASAFDRLAAFLPDDTLGGLLDALRRRCRTEFGGDVGLPQGCPTSPVLTNVALAEVDGMAWQSGIALARYADDMLVLARDQQTAVEHLDAIRSFVEVEGMHVNEDKSAVMPFSEGFTFLGVEFVDGLPVITDETTGGTRRALYVAGARRTVTASRGRLRVERHAGQYLTVPQEHVERIVSFGPVGISAGVRQWALDSGRPIIFLTTHGRFAASLQPPRHEGLRTRRRQYAMTDDPTWQLPVARRIVHGKIANQRALLLRYGSGERDVCIAADILRSAAEGALTGASRAQLMGIEGAGGKEYWSAFARLLPSGSGFTTRARRPPPDAVNAALSLGYALLAAEAEGALAAAGLDPADGVLHEAHRARASLALDLIEEFRPLIVDTVVLDLFRRRSITAQMVAPQESGGVWLDERAREALLRRYERRMTTVAGNARVRQRVSYRRALHLQAEHLAHLVKTGLADYEPMRWR